MDFFYDKILGVLWGLTVQKVTDPPRPSPNRTRPEQEYKSGR